MGSCVTRARGFAKAAWKSCAEGSDAPLEAPQRGSGPAENPRPAFGLGPHPASPQSPAHTSQPRPGPGMDGGRRQSLGPAVQASTASPGAAHLPPASFLFLLFPLAQGSRQLGSGCLEGQVGVPGVPPGVTSLFREALAPKAHQGFVLGTASAALEKGKLAGLRQLQTVSFGPTSQPLPGELSQPRPLGEEARRGGHLACTVSSQPPQGAWL